MNCKWPNNFTVHQTEKVRMHSHAEHGQRCKKTNKNTDSELLLYADFYRVSYSIMLATYTYICTYMEHVVQWIHLCAYIKCIKPDYMYH